MKLSVILVSVTLPIAATTGAAYSAEPAKSDKADWLKSSLASLDTSVNQKKAAKSRKIISFSQPAADSAVGLRAGSCQKLRPFVPNRKLPSQRDLDMQLIAQTAKMAEVPSQTAMVAPMRAPLSGNVAEVYAMMPDQGSSSAVATYGAVGYVKQSSSRVVPGQVPAVQNQIRQFRSGKRTRYIPPQQQQSQPQVDPTQMPLEMQTESAMPLAPMPMQMQSMQMQQQPMPMQMQSMQMQQQPMPMQMQSMQMQQQPMQMQQQPMPMQMQSMQMQAQRAAVPMLMPMQAPPLTPDEQAIIDRMSQNAAQRSFDGTDPAMSAGNSMSSAGPPPFPLSLLPQASLKQFIGASSRSCRSDAPPSYFGSWHGVPTSNLPQSGFRSYTGRSSRSQFSHYQPHAVIASAPASRPVARPVLSRSRPQLPQSTRPMAQLRRLPPQDIKVAPYASYPRLSGATGY